MSVLLKDVYTSDGNVPSGIQKKTVLSFNGDLKESSIPGTTRKKKSSRSGTGSTQPREYN
jgi:hypothetical protein